MNTNRKQFNMAPWLVRSIDVVSVLLAWFASYYIRFHIIKGVQNGLEMKIIYLTPFIVLISLITFSHNGLHTVQRYFTWHHELLTVFKCHFQSLAAFIVGLYMLNPSRLSRGMLGLYAILSVIISLIFRLMIRAVRRRLRMNGKDLKHVILIGYSQQINKYARLVQKTAVLGLIIDGWFDSEGEAEKLGVPEISSLEDIEDKNPDSLIIGYESQNFQSQNAALTHFNKTVVPVWLLPDLEQALVGYTIEEFHGVPLIKFNGHHVSWLGAVAKRILDFTGGIVGMILFFPLMFVVGILIRAGSKGPVLYGQERMSVDGRRFTMWKFRSMRLNTEKKPGSGWWTTQKDDPRITKIGAFIRRTSIDELPQFWNVIMGHMSLVGPRPERTSFVEHFKDKIPNYMLRHKMKAGITGWAQVNGWRGDTSLEKRIEYDIYYIRNWTLFFDLKILFLTLMKGFVNPNAY